MVHTVKFKTPGLELGKADVEFEVWYDGSKIGTLEVSKGSVEWVTKNNSERRRLVWNKFDEFMKQHVPLKK